VPELWWQQAKSMGMIYMDVELENMFTRVRLETNALVDTGSNHLCISAELARTLGFDTNEVTTRVLEFADGTRRKVPQVGPIRLHYADRHCDISAFVIGNVTLLGAQPMQALDLSLHPATHSVLLHEASPCKGFRVVE
jgi:hypothetical protein